jgi:hypothetical protein
VDGTFEHIIFDADVRVKPSISLDELEVYCSAHSKNLQMIPRGIERNSYAIVLLQGRKTEDIWAQFDLLRLFHDSRSGIDSDGHLPSQAITKRRRRFSFEELLAPFPFGFSESGFPHVMLAAMTPPHPQRLVAALLYVCGGELGHSGYFVEILSRKFPVAVHIRLPFFDELQEKSYAMRMPRSQMV